MKQRAFQITDTTVKEYVEWCKDHKLPSYRQKTKQRFFYLIRTDRLCRDSITGKLVTKKAKSNK